VLSGILGLAAAMVMTSGIVVAVRAHHGAHEARSAAAAGTSGTVSTSSRQEPGAGTAPA
jgi:hypothetical protein